MLVRSTYVLHDTLGITSERCDACVESERRKRDGDSVGGTVSAGTETGSRHDGVVLMLFLDVSTSRRTAPLKGDRLPNGGPHPS